MDSKIVSLAKVILKAKDPLSIIKEDDEDYIDLIEPTFDISQPNVQKELLELDNQPG